MKLNFSFTFCLLKIQISKRGDKIKNINQTLYICLDDSGKLSKKETLCTYGGIIFFSKNERDKFITQYRNITDSLKCKYCNHENFCNNSCPELKCSNIHPVHRRRIMNYIKKYYVISAIIDNTKVYPYILQDKSSKRRYLDYCVRRLIKEAIKNLIKLGKINPNRPLRIILEIDQQTTKSNGYYNLKDGLNEELIHGVSNFDYSLKVTPILHNNLDVLLTYKDSKYCLPIQAADFVAGTVRRITFYNQKDKIKLYKQLSFINFKIFFP